MNPQPLKEGFFYHIYNRGINSCNLFVEKDNYLHFLKLYEKYIEPVAETYAWCLMPNHFHLLVYIKEQKEIPTLPAFETLAGLNTTQKYNPSKQFSHLFNAYSQAFNKRYNRTGSLFEKPFDRKVVTNNGYFRELVFYIHNNPVHHGFVKQMIEYPWTSYETIISLKQTKLQRDKVIGWFDNAGNFVEFHKQKQEIHAIKDLLFDK